MKEVSFSPTKGSELFDCIEKKRKALQEFLTITETLEDRLKLQDIPEVEKLLDQRQGLIQTIDGIDDQIRKARSRNPLNEQEQDISKRLRNIEDILQRAKISDKQCMDMTTAWRDDTKGQLSRMRHRVKAVHGYAQKQTRPPKFLDVMR